MHRAWRVRTLSPVRRMGLRVRRVLIALVLAAGPARAQGPESALPDEAWWEGLADAGSGLHVIEVDSVYRIHGRGYDDLLREMRHEGPGTDEIGTRLGVHVAQWRWSYDYWTNGGNGRCRVAQASVLLRSVIVLPEWVEESDAPWEVARRWPRFRAALIEHETGHRSRARAQGIALWQSLLGLRADTCEELRAIVSETARRVVEEGEAAQREYDRQTAHGVHQGAVWPP